MIPRRARKEQTRAKKIPIFLPGRDLPIGVVRGDTFSKTISSRRGHILTTPAAIAFDRCTLRDAQAAGAGAAGALVELRRADAGLVLESERLPDTAGRTSLAAPA